MIGHAEPFLSTGAAVESLADEPVVWYEGSTLSTRKFLHTDERGSLIAVSNAAGTSIATNKYDEYGIPQSSVALTPAAAGRFMYTGQVWIPEVGLYYYKARFYSPTLGRFMQTDPIGYKDGVNWYAYVGSDPVNKVDPSGLCSSIKSDEIRAECLEKRKQGIENAKNYVQDKSVRKNKKEEAYIEVYNEDTGEVSVRTGDSAAVRSGNDVNFLDEEGDFLSARPDDRITTKDKDGKDVDTNEIVLVTGHTHPSFGERDISRDRVNEGIRSNPIDKDLSKISPLILKTPSGKVKVFTDGKEVK